MPSDRPVMDKFCEYIADKADQADLARAMRVILFRADATGAQPNLNLSEFTSGPELARLRHHATQIAAKA
jgi:hypothetical protein